MREHEDDHKWNSQEQFGSKKGCSAQELSVNMKLVDNIMRLSHSDGAFIFNDAKDCYDRMAHPILSFSLQCLGIALLAVKMLLHPMQRMQHFIRTGFGDSDTFYMCDNNRPLQGVLQGNGAAPSIWAAMTVPLINVVRRLQGGFQGRSPITHEAIHMTSFSFVDGSTLSQCVLGRTGQNPTVSIQRISDQWNEALAATGRMISVMKSYTQVCTFQSERKNKWHLTRNKHTIQLTMDQNSTPETLQVLNPEETGKDTAVKQYLLGKLKGWALCTKEGWWSHDMMESALRTWAWKAAE